MTQSQALPVSPEKAAKPELKTCKLGRYYGAKLHLALGDKTICGREGVMPLRKTKFGFGPNCCKFCWDCQIAAMSPLLIVNPLAAEGLQSLFRTHPPTQERIRRLLELASL